MIPAMEHRFFSTLTIAVVAGVTLLVVLLRPTPNASASAHCHLRRLSRPEIVFTFIDDD
jgi:hypothetical protein